MRAAVVFAGCALLAAAVAAGQSSAVVGGVAAGTVVIAAATWFGRILSRWEGLVGGIVLLILFIPIKRYKLAAGLPFDLEPYRIAVGAATALWVSALLVDPRVRLRHSFLDKPLLLIIVGVLGSVLTNIPRIGQTTFFNPNGSMFVRPDLSAEVLKKLLFLLSFYLVFYLIVSVVRDERAVHRVLTTLVGGATIVAFFGIVEARTGYNIFDHVKAVLPVLSFEGALTEEGIARGGRLRVYASSQHPIALAIMFVMMLPIAIYLYQRTRHQRWILAAVLIGLGAIATVSRTSMTALLATAVVFIWLRPAQMKRLWPLILPALVVVHLALPGAIGGIRQAFFPSGGLIQNQTVYGGRASPERIGPEIARIKANPAFGAGYGTRITDGTVRQNARILDNEWLGTAAETGFVGLIGWLWLFARLIRRAGREARRDHSPRGLLLAAFAAAAAAFAVGMLTYDAFSFVQVTFVLFIVAALAAAVLRTESAAQSDRAVAIERPSSFRRPSVNIP